MAYISDASPEQLEAKEMIFAGAEAMMGFRPNSMKIMARKPEFLDAFTGLMMTVWAPSALEMDLKNLVAYMASYSAGCVYCQAHTAHRFADQPEKIKAIWSYETSDLFSEADRAVLRFTQAAVQQPAMAGEAEYAELKKHFSEDQIVDMVSIISVFGFLNRWNDTLGTVLEEKPKAFGEDVLAASGWETGKHSA